MRVEKAIFLYFVLLGFVYFKNMEISVKNSTHSNYSTNLLICQHLLFVSQNVNNSLHLPKMVKNSKKQAKSTQNARFIAKIYDSGPILPTCKKKCFRQNKYIFDSLRAKNERKCVNLIGRLLTFFSFGGIIILFGVRFYIQQ